MRGQAVENAAASIRLFGLCEAMKWAHLPVPGGIYAQHPRLLEEFEIIFTERARHQEAQERERERKASRTRSRTPTRSTRRHR